MKRGDSRRRRWPPATRHPAATAGTQPPPLVSTRDYPSHDRAMDAFLSGKAVLRRVRDSNADLDGDSRR